MKKEYVIILVLVAAAAIWYFFLRGTATASTSPVVYTPSAGGPPPGTVATATQPSQQIAVPGYSTDDLPQSTLDSVILPWIGTMGPANKANATSAYAAMTVAEKNGLYDLINNYWNAGIAPPDAADNFW